MYDENRRLNLGPAIELGDVRLDQEFVFYDNKQKKYKIIDRSKYERRAVKGGGFLIFVHSEGEAEQFAQSEDKVHVVLPPKPKLTIKDLLPGEEFHVNNSYSKTLRKLSGIYSELSGKITCHAVDTAWNQYSYPTDQEVERYVPF